MKREDGYIRYTGAFEPDLEKHDGGLRPAVGTWNVQAVRANRTHPEENGGCGNTYNHAPNLTFWRGRFYLAWLTNPVSEHLGAGQTLLATSADALHWETPRVLFPPYPLDLSLDNGPRSDLFREGDCACMHQRMNFYIAPNGRLLAFGFYGLAPEVWTMPCSGYGIGRAVREIREDGSLGPVYMALYSTSCGYNERTCRYPKWTESGDPGFREAVEAALGDKLNTLQWWEENRDWPEEDFFAVRGAGQAFNWYPLPDGRLVGLWKHSRTSLSEDGGKSWAPVRVSPSLIMSGGKMWGERTGDGRYALLYNPNTDTCHRWPLAAATGENGIEYDGMLCVHGEVPPQRFWGFWRDMGPSYVRGLEGGAVSPDGALYVTYSVNKEDIWVSRVPVPLTGIVGEHGRDDFDRLTPRTWIPGWNAYSGKWTEVSLERVHVPGEADFQAIRLRDRDPWDYAKAVRVFPESERVRLRAGVQPRQNYFGRLEIDLEDGRGVCVFRVIFDSDRTLKLKHGNAFSVYGTYGSDLNDLIIEADCAARTVTFRRGEEKAETWKFFNSARTVERLVFRTGRKRRSPTLEDDREFQPPEDQPGADDPLKQESVWYIRSFESEGLEA